MLARACDGHAVQQLEEVEVQRVQDGACGALCRGQPGPGVEGSLRATEDFFDALASLQLLAKRLRFAFVGQGELIPQVVEAVIDRRGRQHQHLGLHAFPDDLVHQLLVARLLVLVDVVVAEVVRLVDDHKVIVAPVDPVQRRAEGFAAGAAEVGMAKDVVVEAVLGEDVRLEVAVVVDPVVGQLLGAKHQNRFVAQLVVLDHGQRRECLAQAHAVGQDAAAVGFQLVDDAGGGVLLKVEELLPDQRVLVAGAVVGEYVLVDVVQELVENVVEHQEVDALWGVLLVDRGNVLANLRGHVLQLFGVVPDLIEQAEVGGCKGGLVHFVDEVGDRIAGLVTQVHRRETVERHVGGVHAVGLHNGERLHGGLGAVALEPGLAAHPVSALLGDGALGQLVAQLNLELAAVEAAFAVELGNVEFLALFANLVGDLAGRESWGGEDEAEFVDLL